MPVQVAGVTEATELSCGEADNCVVTASGRVQCWGANDHGQLGDGTSQPRLGAVDVIGIGTAAHVAAGDAFNCAILTSGNVVCWGLNNVGQLGDGKDPVAEPNSPIPVQVKTITDAVQMSIGESHACAVLSAGSVVCWGNNDFEQLGQGEGGGAPASSNTPLEVVGIANAKFVELGEKHSCAWLDTNELFCWGNNSHGQLGDGTVGGTAATPVKVTGLNVPKDVSGGGDHTCAHIENGSAYCWGDNTYGQSGREPATVPETGTPLTITGLTGVRGVTVGNEHSCVQLASNDVYCWGSNSLGQLGDGQAEQLSVAPIKVPLD